MVSEERHDSSKPN